MTLTAPALLETCPPGPATPPTVTRDPPVAVETSTFATAAGTAELHVIARPTAYADVAMQLRWLAEAYERATRSAGFATGTAVFRRLFCSDPANQAEAIAHAPPALVGGEPCAFSGVGQPPAPPAKVALWAYHVHDPAGPLEKSATADTLSLRRGGLTHHFTTGLAAADRADAHGQTEAILRGYSDRLASAGRRLADHLGRTWFFVRDIDAHYRGLVEARRAWFDRHGLTADTHYVASSGIGQSADPRQTVVMDAYAVAGLQPAQVRHLRALDHLSPTAVYGVTFERATAIAYRDREHLWVSGTASIDRDGRIVHPGDVARQTDRTLTNVAALLCEAGAGFADVQSWIVYLRDLADAPAVEARIRDRAGDAPLVVVAAPVCRPGWLVEAECLAVRPATHPDLPHY